MGWNVSGSGPNSGPVTGRCGVAVRGRRVKAVAWRLSFSRMSSGRKLCVLPRPLLPPPAAGDEEGMVQEAEKRGRGGVSGT
jgi:hypothetical protein